MITAFGLLWASAPGTSAAVIIVTDMRASANTDVALAPFQRNVHTVSGPIFDEIHKLAGTPGGSAAYAEQYVSAAANEGSIAVMATSEAAGSFNPNLVSYTPVAANGDAGVRLMIDDIVFTGPGSTVTTSLLLNVNGSLDGNATALTPDVIARGGGSVFLAARLANPITSVGQRSFFAEHIGGHLPTSGIVVDTAPLTGVVFPATMSFGPVTLLLSRSYSLEVRVSVSSGASLSSGGPLADNGAADGAALFGTTVSFPTTGPVFALPPGFDANSVSAQIANNRWLGTPVSLIPLPAASWMFASGVAVLLLRRRRESSPARFAT